MELARIFDKEFVFLVPSVFAAVERATSMSTPFPHQHPDTQVERAPKTNNLLTEVHLIVKESGQKGPVDAGYSGTTRLRRSF
jgi:hypothetical protein